MERPIRVYVHVSFVTQHRWRQEQRSEDSKQMAKVISKFVSRWDSIQLLFDYVRMNHWWLHFYNRNFPKKLLKLMRPEVMHNEMCVGVVRVWCLHAVDAWAPDILFSSLCIHHHIQRISCWNRAHCSPIGAAMTMTMSTFLSFSIYLHLNNSLLFAAGPVFADAKAN